MLTSMTGFGRSLLDAPFGKLIVEIQSVNRKYLEVSISLPKEYSRFEFEIRKWIGETLSRGQISVRIFVIPTIDNLLPDFEQLKSAKERWEEMAMQLGYESQAITLPFLLEHLPTSPQSKMDRDEDLAPLKSGVTQALSSLVAMKQLEGKALAHDISSRLTSIEKALASIEILAPDTVVRMKERLKERIFEASSSIGDTDDRMLREIAIFAEKVDISEEITRFKSHVAQFRELLKEKNSMGRKLEFLVQELGREINTIGSKSLESKISHLVVEVKSELEKIREQIQNVE